jgi:hypothetical protein
MKISYAITVCNELEEIKRLVDFLHRHKRVEDEICVLLDTPKASQDLLDQLYRYSSSDWIILNESAFQGHFADWKNELTKMCSGDYIFQIDADEIPSKDLIESLPEMIEYNADVDVYLVPRVNTVDGLTQDHMQQWGWNVNEHGWVNFPDYQWRIYKSNGIKWINKVHERLDGFNRYTVLPQTEEYALFHPKTIERQIKQNNYYTTL